MQNKIRLLIYDLSLINTYVIAKFEISIFTSETKHVSQFWMMMKFRMPDTSDPCRV